MTIRIAVGMATGGTGKTTTAGSLALLAAERFGSPETVLVVDTDQQGQIVSWQHAANQAGREWPLTLTWLNSQLADELDRQQRARDLAAIVIDTSNNSFRLITDAFAAADVVVVPVQPTTMDLDRMAATRESIEFAEAKNPAMTWGALISRYDSRSRDAQDCREALREAGLPVFETQIPALKRIGHSFGSADCPDPDLYGALWEEILGGAA